MSKNNIWIITTDRTRPIREILHELSDAGLVVSHVLETMGAISGWAEDRDVDNLRNVRGVTNVWLDNSLDAAAPATSSTW